MNTAVRMVKMNACRTDTSTSKPVRATSSAPGTAAPTIVVLKRAAVRTAKVASSRWPASMLAKSRTARAKGRTKMSDTKLMTANKGSTNTGTPGGNMIDLR